MVTSSQPADGCETALRRTAEHYRNRAAHIDKIPAPGGVHWPWEFFSARSPARRHGTTWVAGFGSRLHLSVNGG